MRKLKQYVPQDDFDMPKEIDPERYTAVLIRQSEERAAKDHIFSREMQLELPKYAMRLRREKTDKWIRIYDEGAGVSGQKRIDEREELNHLYYDIKHGVVDDDGVRRTIGSLVVINEDRLFRDEFHTNDTTFIQLLAEYNVLLFVRTDHRRYDCTKHSDRNALLDKLIASRNYLDDHVYGRMNTSQEAKALQGLFDGRNLAMGYVVDKKAPKKEQTILVYEPWIPAIRWLFSRFKELDSISKLGYEIEAMPYLFPDPTAEDFLRYTFKVIMTKYPGGFKPTSFAALTHILTNPIYIGCWVYKDAIVRWDNHEAIVDKELFMWVYQRITGHDLDGNPVEGMERRKFQANSAQAVLKHVLTTPLGSIYVANPEQPLYMRIMSPHKSRKGPMHRDKAFSFSADLLDDIFLARIKALALADQHIAEHIKASIDELEEEHVEAVVSIDDQLAHVRLEIQKTLAFLHDEILTLTAEDKGKYNKTLAGLRNREKELIEAQNNTPQTTLKEDFQDLADVLADIPGKLDSCTMERKQKLARLITESVVIEDVSVHWLRFTVFWRGPLAARPDVCLIWCQRGRRHVERWNAEEDEYIKANCAAGDKWEILNHFPEKTWNMIRERALLLGVRRQHSQTAPIADNVTVSDLNVIPDSAIALQILEQVAQTSSKTVKRDSQSFSVWLYPAGLSEFAEAIEHRDGENGRGNGNGLAIPLLAVAVSSEGDNRGNGNLDETADSFQQP
jgi:DNA invertase Pin-like site-specific DNA recombinase/F0F1-type ATP synthase membrane subunit b/b'